MVKYKDSNWIHHFRRAWNSLKQPSEKITSIENSWKNYKPPKLTAFQKSAGYASEKVCCHLISNLYPPPKKRKIITKIEFKKAAKAVNVEKFKNIILSSIIDV